MNHIWILAQTDSSETGSGISSGPATSEDQTTTTAESEPTTPGGAPGGAPSSRGFGGPQQLIFMGFIFVMMYLLLFRGPRKKQQQHKQMMQALVKSDRVQTIGGIIGTVVDIRDDEITLKIDESNNTKVKILRSAISRNMSKDKS